MGLIIASWAMAGPTSAQMRDPAVAAEIERLFQVMATTGSLIDARAAERRIWALWQRYDGTDPVAAQAFALGMAHLSRRQPQAAIEAFDTVIARDPDFVEAWNKRATAFFLMGNLEESLADIAEVLAREPRHFGALGGLALINRQSGRDRAALAAYEQVLEITPHNIDARLQAERLRRLLGARGG